MSVLSVFKNLRRIAEDIGFTDAARPMKVKIAAATEGESTKNIAVAIKGACGALAVKLRDLGLNKLTNDIHPI